MSLQLILEQFATFDAKLPKVLAAKIGGRAKLGATSAYPDY